MFAHLYHLLLIIVLKEQWIMDISLVKVVLMDIIWTLIPYANKFHQIIIIATMVL